MKKWWCIKETWKDIFSSCNLRKLWAVQLFQGFSEVQNYISKTKIFFLAKSEQCWNIFSVNSHFSQNQSIPLLKDRVFKEELILKHTWGVFKVIYVGRKLSVAELSSNNSYKYFSEKQDDRNLACPILHTTLISFMIRNTVQREFVPIRNLFKILL